MNTENPFSPTCSVPDPNTHLSRCVGINFVAACLAADLFSYVGAEIAGNRQDVEFILEDPHQLVTEYQKRYKQGVFPRVNPKLYAEVRTYLAGEVNRVLNGARRGQ